MHSLTRMLDDIGGNAVCREIARDDPQSNPTRFGCTLNGPDGHVRRNVPRGPLANRAVDETLLLQVRDDRSAALGAPLLFERGVAVHQVISTGSDERGARQRLNLALFPRHTRSIDSLGGTWSKPY